MAALPFPTTTAAGVRRAWLERCYRPVALGLTLVVIVAAAVVLATVARGSFARGIVGWDARLYADIGRMWLATGDAYYPAQAAPYRGEGIVNLYPPLALYFFVPLALSPVRLLWWVIPLSVTAGVIIHHRPAPWAWPLMALPMATVPFAAMIAHGNSLMWVMAAFALGTLRPGMVWLAAFKPPALLLAMLFGVSPSWWRAIPVVVLATVPFGGLWFDWLAALGNYEGDTILYGIYGWPILLIPVVAWAGRRGGVTAPSPPTPRFVSSRRADQRHLFEIPDQIIP